MNLGKVFPDFAAKTTIGDIKLYDYLGNSWGIVFSHPLDFTPVCTTEISRMAQLQPEFASRGVKILVLSVDPVEDHLSWLKDVNHYGQTEVQFPVIADPKGEIATLFGILDPESDKLQTVRAVFIIGPDKKLKALINYPASTGRSFDEILRVIDSLQLTASRGNIVTPVDWKVGGDVLVKPGNDVPGCKLVTLPSGKEYIKFVKSDN